MSKQTNFPKYDVLGVEVDALTIKQSVDYLTQIASDPKSKALYVVKPYVEFMDKAPRDLEISRLLNEAELCLADGVAVVWGAHYLHGGVHKGITGLLGSLFRIVLAPKSLLKPLPEIFRGINFTLELLKACESLGLKVYLIGSPKHMTIADSASHLRKRFPKLNISGHFTGKLNDELETQLLKSLRSANPDVILVGMGFPVQERLMSRLEGQLSHGAMIGEGGSFDFRELGGRLPRAPRWMRTIHLEWFFRLLIEPWRFKRQISIIRHIRLVYQAGQRI